MKRTAPYFKSEKTSLIILTLSLILFSIGITLDEPTRVLEQAWQICFSCIGIG
jgi:hypothetical protein